MPKWDGQTVAIPLPEQLALFLHFATANRTHCGAPELDKDAISVCIYADGKARAPVPLELRLGLSDGAFTEVIAVTSGGTLEAGDLVYANLLQPAQHRHTLFRSSEQATRLEIALEGELKKAFDLVFGERSLIEKLGYRLAGSFRLFTEYRKRPRGIANKLE
jgi:hypothetical protein